MILYKLGRFLQMVGMFLLPVAIAGEVLGRIDLRIMLMLSGAGALVFFVGWLLQEAGK